MDSTTVAALIAALATVASAAVIAWQAIETRKSAAATVRAADASENALRVANASLELGRKQTRLSYLVANESIRMRLDAAAASVLLEFLDTDADGTPTPACYAIGEKYGSEALKVVELGSVFQEPQHNEQWLYVVFEVAFRNMGASPIMVESMTFYKSLEGDTVSRRNPSFGLRMLEQAPSGVEGYLAVGAPCREWFYTLSLDPQERQHRVTGEAYWSTALAGETGAMDSQEIKILGTIMEPDKVEGNKILRALGPDHNYASRVDVRKQKRFYVLPGERRLEEDPAPPSTD